MFTEDTLEKSLIEVAKQVGWEYIPADSIPRDMQDVLVGSWLKEAIIRLNAGLTSSQADEVIYRLRTAVQAVQPHDLKGARGDRQGGRPPLLQEGFVPGDPGSS